jgi:tetratricopeptide (TPR) repeat protein
MERARVLADRGRVDEAIRLLQNGSRTAPSPPDLAFLASLQASIGALPQAVQALDRALALAPDQRGLRTTRGAMLFELRRFDEARRELERVLAEDSRAALARYYLAAVYRSQGELDRASAMAETAVRLLPETSAVSLGSEEYAPAAAARQLLAEIQFERGEEPEALLREVLALEPAHASARYLLARVLLRRGRNEEAEVELERFRRIKRVDEHLRQGRELARLPGKRDAALSELRLAVEADPEDARALFALGLELLREGKPEEARPWLERAARLQPESRGEIDRMMAAFR